MLTLYKLFCDSSAHVTTYGTAASLNGRSGERFLLSCTTWYNLQLNEDGQYLVEVEGHVRMTWYLKLFVTAVQVISGLVNLQDNTIRTIPKLNHKIIEKEAELIPQTHIHVYIWLITGLVQALQKWKG